MIWQFWLKQFIEVHCSARGLSPKTIDAYHASLQQFRTYVRFRVADRSPAELAPVDILNYVEHLRKERKNGDASVNRQVTILRNFYRACVGMELLEPNANPLAKFPKIKAAHRRFRETLSAEEVGRLLDAPPCDSVLGLRDRAILVLLYGTGIRASECAQLAVRNVDLVANTIRVRGKGGDERVVPLNGRVKDALAEYIGAAGERAMDQTFFFSRKRKPLSRQVIYERVRKYARLARIEKKLSPHGLRHTFATHLVRKGVNLVVLRDLLGHRQLTSTQIYLNMTAEDLRKATNMHPIGKLLKSVADLLPDKRLPFQYPPGKRFASRR